METVDSPLGRDEDGGERLLRTLASLRGDGVERRHEELIEWAEQEGGLDRAYAEEVYKLAEEEGLEPVYALHIVNAGVGVRELTEPDQDMDEVTQEAPPEWVAEETVELTDVALERRLRATFRRFRAHLEESGDAREAALRFLRDTDVAGERLR